MNVPTSKLISPIRNRYSIAKNPQIYEYPDETRRLFGATNKGFEPLNCYHGQHKEDCEMSDYLEEDRLFYEDAVQPYDRFYEHVGDTDPVDNVEPDPDQDSQ